MPTSIVPRSSYSAQRYKYSLNARGRLAAILAGGAAAWEGLGTFNKLVKSAEKAVEKAADVKRQASQQLTQASESLKKIKRAASAVVSSPPVAPVVSAPLRSVIRAGRIFGSRRRSARERRIVRAFTRRMKRKNVYRRL